MTQFVTMILPQGGATTLKATSGTVPEAPQAATARDSEALSFAQTLQELSETNPNAAALLLALQQAGMVPELPGPLQISGSLLPSVTNPGGNALPPLPLQSTQLESLASSTPQLLTVETLQSLDSRQLQQLFGDKVMPDKEQMLSQLVKSGLGGEALQFSESRGLGDFGAQLQGLGLNLQPAQSALAQRSMLTLPVQVPVGQSGWDNAVGERIQWMVSRNVQQAEIKLTPPELGPMEIKISLQNDQTNVHFVASHSATRDALEAAIPRLRELFNEVNLNLANVDVNQRQEGGSPGQDGSGGNEAASDGPYAGNGFGPSAENAASSLRLQSEGLLDTYA